MGGTVQGTVTLVDAQKWAKRALVIDLFALGLMVIVGLALIRDSFNLGAAIRNELTMSTWINHLLLDVSLGMAAMAWLTYRLIRHSYREMATPS